MSATTVTPYRPQQAHRPDSFGCLVHAEWTKFRTVRGWVIAMVLAAVLIDAFGLLIIQGKSPCGSSRCPPYVATGPGGEAVNDSYYLVGQPLAGNGSVTVRVTSLTGTVAGPSGGAADSVVPWAKAGVIIAASTRPGSAYAAMMVTGGHGVRMQYDYVHDTAGLAGRVSAASPRWLRLVRTGGTITGYDSADGRRWARVGTIRLASLGATVQAGLFATSPLQFTANFPDDYAESGGSVSGTTATGVFDHATIQGAAAGGQWHGISVTGSGSAGTSPGTGPAPGYRVAAGQFRITGSGDIGPVISGGTNTGYITGTIGHHLLGVFLGLLVMVVIAAMFITAEYRRGLIRTSLAASPRRGRLLAAKALVIGLVTFVLGMAAVAVAVIAGSAQSRAGGMYILPVSPGTEIRVIAGTGAMLALCAVLAVAVGVALRRSVAAVATVVLGISLPYVLGLAGGVLPATAAEWVLRVTPAAGFAIEQSVPQYHQVLGQYAPPEYFPLGPWAGLGVLCAYTAAALCLAGWLLRRRDV